MPVPRNKILAIVFLVIIAANAQAAVELGIDVLERDEYAPLKGKRIGLVTNQTGVDSRRVRTRGFLKKNANPVALLHAGTWTPAPQQLDRAQQPRETRNV